MTLTRVVVPVLAAAALLLPNPADACGCFAPPSSVDTVVQAGERIVFAVRNGTVISHVQIQYAGPAQEFGWLLPLPSVPTLKLGSDEVFNELGVRTLPTYDTTTVFACRRPTPTFGCSAPSVSAGTSVEFGSQDAGVRSPVVVQASIGPYEYAVLKADDRVEMLNWLNTNRYFIPTGTDTAVAPYIHPGAYFLALRLRAGANTQDITPVILEYQAQYPMIPLVLTSVGATPNMGVQVYLVGEGRGIPRNYHHVVLNDALLGWMDGSRNYQALVTRAVSEAPGKHAFVTEYAGTSSLMKDVLAPASRFGTEADLATKTDPIDFVQALYNNRFAVDDLLPSPVVRALATQLPVPAGLDPQAFFHQAGYYLTTSYRQSHPDDFANYPPFDAATLAHEIFTSYVAPMRETNALFAEFPTLTRLFTTLSPEDMTVDPVFAFAPGLPDVSRAHAATFSVNCSDAELVTEQGWVVPQSRPGPGPTFDSTPGALRVEVLHEDGSAPEVVVDNTAGITTRFSRREAAKSAQGCAMGDPLSLVGAAALLTFARRRRSFFSASSPARASS
ncbi:MAG: DUF2330 domain-containing protein [Myxococcaceae bacterium]